VDDGDAAVDGEGDDSLSSEDPHSSLDVVFYKVSSLDLIWGGVSLFCRVVCLGSLRRMRLVKVFDETVLMAGHTGGRYGRALPVPMPVKVTGSCPCIVLLPRCIIKC
jgi:hypothetical protein